ncbi:MAG: F0F1 ATP synthase subunit A [Deltaproteobacteria bacterium]|nr:F0F1 ATP synthase subunit A [Deltaproteobacteria bacterium]
MKKFVLPMTGLLTLVVAAPAWAEASIHTWSVIPYISGAIAHALGTDLNLDHVVMYSIVCLFLAVAGGMVGARYKKKLETGDIAPSPAFSFANLLETIVGMVLSLLDEIVGHGARKHLPLIGSLALVILFNNLAGLIPGSGLATSNENTTLAMALCVFVYYNYCGIRAHGAGKYLAHFMGPLDGPLKYAMAPIMVPIELISHLARPLSLSLRLFGNMTGDHTILGVFLVGLGISVPVLFRAAVPRAGIARVDHPGAGLRALVHGLYLARDRKRALTVEVIEKRGRGESVP